MEAVVSVVAKAVVGTVVGKVVGEVTGSDLLGTLAGGFVGAGFNFGVDGATWSNPLGGLFGDEGGSIINSTSSLMGDGMSVEGSSITGGLDVSSLPSTVDTMDMLGGTTDTSAMTLEAGAGGINLHKMGPAMHDAAMKTAASSGPDKLNSFMQDSNMSLNTDAGSASQLPNSNILNATPSQPQVATPTVETPSLSSAGGAPSGGLLSTLERNPSWMEIGLRGLQGMMTPDEEDKIAAESEANMKEAEHEQKLKQQWGDRNAVNPTQIGTWFDQANKAVYAGGYRPGGQLSRALRMNPLYQKRLVRS